ncbi:MAG: hypothetical protein EHM20_02240 [Alphaproteobacteria bacterium]|nr:MAG: hypothetical protein EHM20_02240 [Alphaproteobacteria bacterium]
MRDFEKHYISYPEPEDPDEMLNENFISAFPPLMLFADRFNWLTDFVANISSDNISELLHGQRTVEISFIGLISYFEAFLKGLFSIAINLLPDSIENLRRDKHNTNVDAYFVAKYVLDKNIPLGTLLTENFDFGTAQKANSLFCSLLKLTPFSKDDARMYNEVLQNRNLIVHHGAAATFSHAEDFNSSSNYHVISIGEGLTLDAIDYFEAAKLIGEIAIKINKAVASSISKKYAENKASVDSNKNDAVALLSLEGNLITETVHIHIPKMKVTKKRK